MAEKQQSASARVRELAEQDPTGAVEAQIHPQSEAQKLNTEPQSVSDMEQKGDGVMVPAAAPADRPVEKGVAHVTPRHDVPVAVSVIGQQNTHVPPDLREFTPEGRVRPHITGENVPKDD